MKSEDTDRSERYRLDFVQTVLKVDEASRTFVVKLEPDPKRYEWKESQGKRYLFDSFDNIAISEEAYMTWQNKSRASLFTTNQAKLIT